MAANDKMATVLGAAITSGTTQSFTISGFGTPTAAIVLMNRATGTISDDAGQSVGFTDGTNEFVAAFRLRDAVNSEQADHIFSTASLGWMPGAGSNPASGDADFSFSQWVTDGIEITWNTLPSIALKIQVILIQCANAQVGIFSSPSGADNSTTVTMSPVFAPQTVFTASSVTSGTPGSDGSFGPHANMKLGIADFNGSTIEQASHTFNVNNGSSDGSPVLRLDETYALIEASGSIRCELTNFDSDSFDATTRNVGNVTPNVGYLSLGWNSVDRKIAYHDAPTGTATVDKSFTWPGFRPQFVMLVLSDMTALGLSTVNTAGTGAVCSFNDNAEESQGWTDEDLAASMNTSAFASSGTSGIRLLDDEQTLIFEASFANGSWDANGYTLEFTTIPSSGTRKWLGFALQEEGAGGQAWPSPTKQMAHLLLR